MELKLYKIAVSIENMQCVLYNQLLLFFYFYIFSL